jgi:hypothetical protein
MEPFALIDELKTLAVNEDALAVSREVSDLKSRFDNLLLELERANQVAAMEAEINGDEFESIDIKAIKDAFYEIYLIYRDRRKEQASAKEAIENENLRKKKVLISKLNQLIASEENIGTAVSAYKEIHENWKQIGDIPRDSRDAIQQEYSRALEDFFYNIKIYRELKDHDLKRNTQLKRAIIGQIAELLKLTVIKDIEQQLKLLQNDWEEIGPVQNEEWEAIKEEYWKQVKAVYARINLFYEDRKQILAEQLKLKQELVVETASFIEAISETQTVKSWDELTSSLLEFQERWKTIGFGPRKENEELWAEFRMHCDNFFQKKRAFYNILQEKNKVLIQEKKRIITEAIQYKDSTDWKNASDKLIQLQKQWKNSGNTGQKTEQKLWQEFRSACDAFFNAKQKHFEAQDKLLEDNLTAKEALIVSIEKYELSEDKKQALQDLRNFSASFNEIGRVPIKSKDSVYAAYKAVLDKHYGQLKLEGDEKDKVMFQARIETLAASPEASKAFAREKASIRKEIDQLKQQVLQYENNLGFLSRSKSADLLRKDVEGKININKTKIEALIKKLKMIPNE